MFKVLAYIKFLLKSTNQHGVHSPFVYNLVTKCFYDNTNHEDYSKLTAYKNSLLNNKSKLEITDFGAGSKIFKSNSRSVNRIAKHSGSTIKRAKLLYRLTTYFKPNSVLELGTSLGIATQAMALGNSKSNITSIEGCKNISEFASQQLSNFKIDNVQLKTGAFNDVIPTLNQPEWDLIFFDGHHNKKATINYFNMLVDTAQNDSVFIFDDIHWSKEMTQAWEEIKQHHKVTVTIDTFFWGFVFFRKEQVKEHFTIRL